MIIEQRSLNEIFSALCEQTGPIASQRQVVFYVMDGHGWMIAGKGDLTLHSQEILDGIDPENVSGALFTWSSLDGKNSGYPFDRGWATHLISGMGELLGVFVSIADGPMMPFGTHASRINLACRLATLAIEQNNLLEELVFKANHDMLTGLFNRGYFQRVLASTLQQKEQLGGCAALLYINLDRFRVVNDVLGHSIGDRLLESVGQRFLKCLPANDVLARAGGDEFTVLIPELTDDEEASVTAGRFLTALAEPFLIDGHQLFISASIGISCSAHETTPESLERAAYIALHKAKRAGKSRWTHYDPSMASTPPERLEMEKHLRSALQRNEMLLYYQPQIELSTGVVAGAEVLMRWRPGDLGIVSPGAFIPILEETGLIVEFGRWALLEACRQGKLWADKGMPLRLAVNVSAFQFGQPGFIRDVERALSVSGFPPEWLELELTESLFIGDFATACRVFRALQNTGIIFALDDFGTGQSSLAYLQQLPFQRLKIDQSFIRPIRDGERFPPLVENIIRMAGSLGLSTIAEGIETAHQANLLRMARCKEGQGYFFAQPLPAEEFAEYCRSQRVNATDDIAEDALVGNLR